MRGAAAANNARRAWRFGGAAIATAAAVGVASASVLAAEGDYDAVREEIEEILDDSDWDDGSYGPVFVRLAWHASGTYDKTTKTGGSNGATMRFAPESLDGANAGLEHARNKLEAVKAKFPWISYADLWTLAGAVAVESMGGPKIPWRPGRTDAPGGHCCPPVNRLPDAAQGAQHVRDVFYRMGFNDQQIVALAGAHAVGRCHTDRSGYDGPWTFSPTTFSNSYFQLLLEDGYWRKRKWDGPEQFEDPTGALMMLPADMSLVDDPEFRKWVEIYAKDQDRFFADFASAFGTLIELGCPWSKGACSCPAKGTSGPITAALLGAGPILSYVFGVFSG